MTEAERSRAARAAAEAALVRVVHHYGARPEFVVIGGLVPELLCAGSGWRHAGTTDVDVQVDLEVAAGAVSAARLEQALVSAEFQPDSARVWRWMAEGHSAPVVVKFELLTDLDDQPEGATIHFDGCVRLGLMGVYASARPTCEAPDSPPGISTSGPCRPELETNGRPSR